MLGKIKGFYEKRYKALLILPILLFIAAVVVIGMKYAATGDFINRDVSLKGGISFTIPVQKDVDNIALGDYLKSKYPTNDVFVKSFRQSATSFGLIVDIDFKESNQAIIDQTISYVSSFVGADIKKGEYSYEFIESSLGASFFRQTFIALGIAFLFMGIVVFFYFKTVVPSLAVIISVIADIVTTVAIVDVLGIRIGTAGLSALLMLIGYSVNTDILLTTRALKRKEATEMERIYSSIKTGFMTAGTTMAVSTVALIVADSEVIRQIMTVVFIGMIIDMINTWITNVALIRMYLEKKHKAENRQNES